MKDKQKAIIFILLVSILGGATQAITKIGLFSFPPLSFAFVRFLIAGIAISPFLVRKNFLKSLWKLAPFSLLGTINITFFILGIKTTTATIGTVLYAGVPLLSALFLFLIFRNRLSLIKEFGIALGFFGVIIVALLPIIEKGSRFSGDLLGNMLIGVGVISWSLYMVHSKKKLEVFSPFVVTASFIWVTCIVLFPLFLIELNFYPNWWRSMTVPGALSLGYISIVSTIIVYLLNQYAIKHGGAILASMQYYLVPIFAYVFAFFLLGEQLTFGLVIGSLLALLGVYITTKK
jgi:drug/metabolite transporter (DMT)-like permease